MPREPILFERRFLRRERDALGGDDLGGDVVVELRQDLLLDLLQGDGTAEPFLDPEAKAWWASQPWLIENGFLTPTMKIKRRALEQVYGPRVESWYRAGEPVIWES